MANPNPNPNPNSNKEGRGSCLCGGVRFTAKSMSRHVGACHCSMCRKWGGGPFMEVACGTDVDFESQEHIVAYASSAWAERGFCKICGTHLFYRLRETQEYQMPVGLFDPAAGLVFDQQVFIDEKPGYYDFANETENMTGAELFAKFAPPP